MAPQTGKRKPGRAEAKKTQKSSESTTTTTMSSSAATLKGDENIRANDTHIFFWGSVLSNWNQGSKFSGARCFELLLPELEILRQNNDNVRYPEHNKFSTRLLREHSFNCGEQWMMAMKGWFFERDLELSEWAVEKQDEIEFRTLRTQMFLSKMPKEWPEGSKQAEMWNSTICKVLREKKPRSQKSFGRQTRGFDDKSWTLVSTPSVIAACIARAEESSELRSIYLSCGNRGFVEGSPFDTVWGVGIHWKRAEIQDPSLWIGENRLGKCHDVAAVKIQKMFKER